MVKEFKDWIDEFVEQGADPEKVTKWPEDFGGGGPGPIKLQDKTVNPTTNRQEVTADASYNGLRKVTVEAVELQDKVAKPITDRQEVVPDEGYVGLGKVIIDGVNLQEKTVSPNTISLEITPDTNYDGLSKVTIEAIELQNKEISPSTSSQSVIPDKGYDGLREVTVNAIALQDKTVTPAAVRQEITYDSNYNGLGKVTVEAIEPVELQDKTVTPTTKIQRITADSNYSGLGTVTVNAVTNTIDSNIKAENIKKNITILGVNGTYEGSGGGSTVTLQEKTVSPTTTIKEVTADSGFDGLSKVTVEAVALQEKIVKPTTSAQEIIPDSGYLGLGKVTVEASEAAETAYYQFIFNNHEDISSKRFSIDWSKLPDFFQETFGISPDLTFSEIIAQVGTSDYAIRFPLAVGDTNTNNKLYFNSEIYFVLEINNNNAYLKRDGYLNGFLNFEVNPPYSSTLREAISLLPTTTTGTSPGIYALLILGVITLTEIN